MKKKVRVTANWATSENIVQRLLDQLKTSEDDVSNIEFVYDNDYEVLAAFNYFTTPVFEHTKAYLFPHEPSWSGSHVKLHHYLPNVTYFGTKKELYYGGIEHCVVESPVHMFYGGTGNNGEDWTYQKALSYNDHPKTKILSSAISTFSNRVAEGCLYPERAALVRCLLDKGVDFVDIYGGWKEGGYPRKIETLLDYRFSLAVENESIQNHFTEKLTDCLITLTVPVYYGCKNMAEIWGEGGYILIPDIHDHAAILAQLEHIHENSEALYHHHLPYLKKMKERYFQDYNLLRKINLLAGS